jgi:hypothetical protein
MRSLASARLAWLLTLLAALCLPLPAGADGIEVKSATLAVSEDGYVLDADFDIALNPTLEETLNRGVPLNFLLELELIRPRWYWFNEKVATFVQQYKISYNALTRQYRLSLGMLSQNFATLNEAVRFMTRVRNLQVAEKSTVKPDNTYMAAVRLRLDVSQLPKPFQISALGSREWNIGSDWYRWTLTP